MERRSYRPEGREEQETSPGTRRFMANLHLIMGAVFIFFGGFSVVNQSFGSMPLDPWQAYGLGALLFVYGIFRIWRGLSDLRRR